MSTTQMDVDETSDTKQESKNDTTSTTIKSQTIETIQYPNFDIQTYANQYQGKVKIDRLLHIARVCPDVAAAGYELAIEEVKKGIDVGLYDQVMEQAQKIIGVNKAKIDSPWMVQQSEANEKSIRNLEDEIQRWRNLSNRERICEFYLKCAEQYVKTGNYTTAISRYSEAKSYATDPKMMLDISLRIIMASIKGNLYGHVKTEAIYALSSEDIAKDIKFQSKVRASLGLANLINGRYEQAVELFLDCSFVIHNQYSEVLSSYDIALYGGLCALATFSRLNLKQRVLENAEFKKFLELAPDVYKVIRWFYDSEYGRVMAALNELKKDLIIDMHIASQVEPLLTSIRGKALVQYFSPYSAMDMKKMAAAFNVTIDEMELQLSTCINNNHIQAKIDSHSKLVYASTYNKRKLFFNQLLQSGDEFTRDMKAILLRMSLMKNQVIVRQQSEEMMEAMNLDMEDSENILGMMGSIGRKIGNFGDQRGNQQKNSQQGKRGNKN